MNSKARQRAMRVILGALLQTDLTISDLRDISNDLDAGTFGSELGEYLREMCALLGEAGRYKSDISNIQSRLSLAQNEIERRRLPKKVVQQLMSLASPWVKSAEFSTNVPMREMVEHYLMVATAGEANKFIDILRGEPADAYLRGISRRDRGK